MHLSRPRLAVVLLGLVVAAAPWRAAAAQRPVRDPTRDTLRRTPVTARDSAARDSAARDSALAPVPGQPQDSVSPRLLPTLGLRLRLPREPLRLDRPAPLVAYGRLGGARLPTDVVAAEQVSAMLHATAAQRAALWGQTMADAFGATALPDRATGSPSGAPAVAAEGAGRQPSASPAAAALPGDQPAPVSAADDSTGLGARAADLLGQYADLGLQLESRLEAKMERNKNERCTSLDFISPISNCSGSFQPQFDFQFNVRTGGTVADRVHVNVDYDSQREFDASNNINVYYEGKTDEIIHRLEVGNVTFQPPSSRFITGGIPAGNYGLQATGQLGPMSFRTIAAQQKGNVVRDRVFTIGDRTVQTVDREIEDYQVERRRFFWVVDPVASFSARYPNIDILDAAQMATLAATLPADRQPRSVRVYRYRPPNVTGSAARDINGPYAVALGSTRTQGAIGPYEVLQQGVDYYIDPTNLWIALVTPIGRDERLAVSYRVGGPGGETTIGSVGGTFPRERSATGADTLVLLWEQGILPADPAFPREMRHIYRLGGEDIQRGTISLKIVVGSGTDQERSSGSGAPTFLQVFGLAQRTNPSAFDVENRLWPRLGDPNQALNAGGTSTKLIRDYFIVFPSLRPFAGTGLARPPDPVNDSLYRTPDEDLISQRRPPTQYRVRARYQAEGGGDPGSLALGSVQVRPNSERLVLNGVPLRRDLDYQVDYELGRVTFNRPDTLFGRPQQVTVQYEENPLFAAAPTSIFGLASEFPFQNGQLNFVAISQSQKTTFNRPPLGFEPASALVAGVNGAFTWESATLTRALDRLPMLSTAAPSAISVQGEFATSRPQPNAAGVAYVESFEGEGGISVSLHEGAWHYGSRPAVQGIGVPIGATRFDFDTARAATLAWQNLGYSVDPATGQLRIAQFYPENIDPLIAYTGGQTFRAPEQVLWLSLYPLHVGGIYSDITRDFRWRLPGRTGRAWRSLSQSLSPSGVDLSRVEYLEFWTMVDTAVAGRERNPALVFDFGDISENSLAFAPETLFVRTAGGRADSTFTGRRIQGFNRLDTERDPLTRSFDAGRNDVGLPGDVVDTLVVIDLDSNLPRRETRVALCRRGNDQVQQLGDTKSNCSVQNRRLDEEDLDVDGFLNMQGDQGDAERLLRYVVDLRDPAIYNRVGRCNTNSSFCWVQVRIPFTAPAETVRDPLVRRIKALRLSLVASPAVVGGDSLTQVPIARLKLTGSPWVKRAERALSGVAGGRTEGSGFVIAGVIGTQDRDPASGLVYESPPGVTDQADDKTQAYQPGQIQINEKSLRLVAGDVPPHARAEAFYRFPEGEKNFMGYQELRVWARGRNKGWGPQGDLQFYIRIGRDQDNFYLYRTPVNAGQTRDAWLPEVRVEFRRFYELRAEIQNNFLRGGEPIACEGLDRELVEASEAPTAPGSRRYAACRDGYIVYTANPGITPPNLAAVQELALGILRVGNAGTGTGGGIGPTDSLELWVDDIRLTGVVDDAGYAGQLGLNITAADVGSVQVNVSRRDRNFRQLAEQPSYITDDQLNVASSVRLEKFLPQALGLALPLTVSYTSSGTDPFFLSRSDVRAGGIEGLRTPRSSATAYALSLRRVAPVSNALVGALVNNLGVNATYATGSSRSEYSVGNSSSLTSSLDWSFAGTARAWRMPGWMDRALGSLPGFLRNSEAVRSLRGTAFRWNPTQLRFTTSYANNTDTRTSFSLPVELGPEDPGRRVEGLTRVLRHAAAMELRPFQSLSARFDVASLRDLRDYGDTVAAGGRENIGVVARGERDRLAGVDLGLERERQMGMVISATPAVAAWIKPRFDLSTSYSMFRDPNAPGLQRLGDSTGEFRLPRRLSNAQGLGAGATVDLGRGAAVHFGDSSVVTRVLRAVQPIDVIWRRDLRSAYDGVPFTPGLGFQFATGGVDDFRSEQGVAATSAGVSRTLGVNSTIALPFGAQLVNRYSSAASTAWARRLEAQTVIESEQVTFPDASLRWSFQPRAPWIRRLVASVGTTVDARRTTSSTFQPTVPEGAGGTPAPGDGADALRGEQVSTQYRVTPSVTWALGGALSTAAGWSRTNRTELRSGGVTVGRQEDINATIGRSFRLPERVNLRSDVRWRMGFSHSRSESFFDAGSERRRVTDNGRWSINTNADTEVSETMNFSLTLSRGVNFDNLYDRRFTQTVLTATLHLTFFAGDLK